MSQLGVTETCARCGTTRDRIALDLRSRRSRDSDGWSRRRLWDPIGETFVGGLVDVCPRCVRADERGFMSTEESRRFRRMSEKASAYHYTGSPVTRRCSYVTTDGHQCGGTADLYNGGGLCSTHAEARRRRDL
jgi:hypothetical protein